MTEYFNSLTFTKSGKTYVVRDAEAHSKISALGSTYIKVQQDVEDAGKALIVGEDGNVIAKAIEVPNLTDYAKLTDIPSLDGYVKASDLLSYAKLTDIPDISGKADKTELADYAKTSDIPSLEGYAKTTDIPSLDGYAKTSDIPSLEGYAKTTDIPDISGKADKTELADYAKTSDIPSLEGYAKTTDIPDISGKADKTELADYAKTSDIPSLEGYAKTTDIPSLDGYAKTSDIPSLEGYAKTTDLPTVETLAYDNPTYTTVKAALDKLLYVTPVVSSFTGGGTYENGRSISSINFAWTVNKTVTTQNINNGVGTLDASLRSYTYTPSTAITSDTTFRLTVGDGTNTAYKDTSVKFQNKIYWGTSANTTLTNADILAFETAGNASFATSRAITKTFNCSGGKYFYFVIPTSFVSGMSILVGGLSFSAYTSTTMASFVNASGKTVSYTVIRPNSVQNGSSIQVEVK